MTRQEEIRAAAEQALKDCPYINTSLIGFDFFVKGAMWADRTMIERASQWLQNNIERYVNPIGYGRMLDKGRLIDDFKKSNAR